MIVDKECENCKKIMLNVNHQARYCDECKKYKIKQSTKKYKKKVFKEEFKHREKELIENFNNVVKKTCHLTPIGFNEVSKISWQTYRNTYKKSWMEILKEYKKYDELVLYVINEYQNFIIESGKQGFKEFCKQNKYISEQILKIIGFDYIRESVKVSKKRNTLDDCRNEFLRLIDMHGRVPLYSEFIKHSNISIKSYIHHLNINGNKIYDEIVRFFVSDEDYESYIDNKSNHKSKTGRNNHQGYKYSNSELKDNLTNIFDEYYSKYKTYPTRKIFNIVSKIDDSVYRNRFNKKWSEICLDYGYEISKQFKSEEIALTVVSEILGEDYIPQKTFDWLIGFKNFPLFCDGYFPSYKLIVEFDGDQHRNPIEWFGGIEVFHEIKTNDKYKDILIPRNGFKLVRISSEEPFTDKDYIRNKLIKNGISIPTPTP